ncbi:IS110 family transposase [Paenibacillus aceris]|uniref:Uncharacterized protein n=1 Tax=Paenibacillus aceris TaxID=869555 RepID=A0ABS4HUF1_9BACL|nr:IS110 family transposase [Paenibacillus aceris]MBP1962249.1 hypothetical protein [Paenibacillus aceris]NHW37076.1 IS110 family transposase [Paenibacillus aceris]
MSIGLRQGLVASGKRYYGASRGATRESIPGTAKMLTIPGVGIVTLAGFLAEVGDLSD